jgi:flagellar protein FlaG
MNSVAQNLQRDLLFSVDEKSGGTFVKVIDKETEEVVREIPSKEVREIKARLEEVAGLIFKESV